MDGERTQPEARVLGGVAQPFSPHRFPLTVTGREDRRAGIHHGCLKRIQRCRSACTSGLSPVIDSNVSYSNPNGFPRHMLGRRIERLLVHELPVCRKRDMRRHLHSVDSLRRNVQREVGRVLFKHPILDRHGLAIRFYTPQLARYRGQPSNLPRYPTVELCQEPGTTPEETISPPRMSQIRTRRCTF